MSSWRPDALTSSVRILRRGRMRMAKRGFTLIELVIVGLLVSLMTAIAILRGARFVDNIEVRGAITEIQSLFSLARHIAIARGSQSTLEIDTDAGVLTV